MKTILFTQGHASQRAVVLLARAAAPHRADLRILASHADDREDILDGADVALREPARPDPRAAGPAYAAWLLAEARAAGVDAVLAMRERAALAAAREDFRAAGIRLACGATTPGALETCARKDLFAARMRAAGLPVPETIAVVDAAGLAHALATLSGAHGACVKPASGVYGRGFWRLDPAADAFAHLEDPDRRVVHPDVFAAAWALARERGRLVVMDYLPGDEHSVDVVCDEGRLVAAAARRKSGSHQVVTTRGPEIDLAEAVVAALGLDGLVNVQTKADGEGVPKLLEVNTRYAGGVGYSAAAGVNLPAIATATLLGLAPAHEAFGGPEPRAVRIVDEPVALARTSARLATTRDAPAEVAA
ncbi:ATP-grasp domain-containing protein [Salinarimonas chemoclinalis]|uniref:ATP-grasp domain-containing protein n=1 Tax=Salinarimonas chemoclinalis TaxID=3241599 RepID=UPI003558430C